jgi:DNA polymerase-3 subunit epsilon
MKLNLKNPIVFFDLETTGVNINTDRIVEICYLKVHPNGNEESKTLRINPEMHIPEEASAIHGIYDADVADCPTFRMVAKNIARDIEGCDLPDSTPTVSISLCWQKSSFVPTSIST